MRIELIWKLPVCRSGKCEFVNMQSLQLQVAKMQTEVGTNFFDSPL